MNLYGKSWSRRDVEARVGRMEQIGGVQRYRCAEGPEEGTEIIRVRTGAGLTYEVTPSRGLDIGLTEYGGSPLSWQSANGGAHPSYYDASGTGWLRTASGGLLMTCGLMQVGSPCEDEGERLGMHGRAHHTPARQVAARTDWQGDEYVMTVSGVIEETSMFGGHLRLARTITSRMGSNRIEIRDSVENAGFASCPHMMLYHFNFGFPLMSEDVRIRIASASIRPADGKAPVAGFDEWQAPMAEYKERVYYHDMTGPYAKAEIDNPAFPVGSGESIGLRAQLIWKTDALPQFVQWKMPGAGVHALGLEPSNCLVEGRTKERQRGTLTTLEPGESRNYELDFQVCHYRQENGESAVWRA